jgi:predicted O-methyltransferase YrrM
MDISASLSISGWMLENELMCLANIASKSKTIVEIGSWMGRSTMAIALNTQGKVYAVDTWKGSNEQEHSKILQTHDENWLLNQFKQNTKSVSNIIPIQLNSRDAVTRLSDKKFDMIFLDASHDYENVYADIKSWKPLLSSHGIICGHDYDDGWPGVKQAVNELIPSFTVVGAIWIAS